jgi:Cu2+-exporting ATPase
MDLRGAGSSPASERIDYSLFVEKRDDGLRHIDLAIESDGEIAINEVERRLGAVEGLDEARLNLTRRRLALGWRDPDFDPMAAIDVLREFQIKAHPIRVDHGEEAEARHAQWLLKCLGVAAFAMMNIMLLSVSVWAGNVTDISPETRDFFHWLSALIALPAAAYAGQPFFHSAVASLKRGELNMDVPITLGVVLALGMSVYETAHHAPHAYFDSAVMLLMFLLAGRYLDQAMRRRTRAAAGNLAALKGDTAHRLSPDGSMATVPVAALAPDDHVLVRPGERAPADGVVVAGVSSVDDSLITGETLRRAVKEGDQVYAGGMNFDGALTLKVTNAAANSLLDEIERLVENAAEAKSRTLRLADRVARMYAPVVHVTALATALFWWAQGAGLHFAVITAIAVLIITCPCALALAVPAVQVVASGSLFRGGVLLNAGDALERVAGVDVVVFDKTGTLTTPDLGLADRAGHDPAMLERAARLALSSRHPLAVALAREASRRAPYEAAREEPGQGVVAIVDGQEARLGSRAFCGAPELSGEATRSTIAFRWGEERAVFEIRQSLRVDAAQTVAAVQAMGLRVMILSGDAAAPVEEAARALGVAQWRAGVKPADKIAAVEALRAQGRRVLMVGDGLNDAPALAAADASMSPIAAVDLARAQADAVFLGDRLRPVAETARVSRLALKLMRQNLGIAVAYNFIAVPLAVAGYVTPLVAAAAMSGSSIIVTLNALRARPRAVAPDAGADLRPLAEREPGTNRKAQEVGS